MSASAHPLAPHALPLFITAPGETDVLLVITGIFLLAAVVGVGLLFLRIHTLPERMAHKSQKLQFEVVAVLGLLALFTHQHIFWVAGLILALIDIPDFASPLARIARGVEALARLKPPPDAVEREQGLQHDEAGGGSASSIQDLTVLPSANPVPGQRG